ncbi:MAG: hypothetical protein Q9169_007587 [Polycauliona sp. 2 TL-2023]
MDEDNRKQGVMNRLKYNHNLMISRARYLALGLLRCSTTVAIESTQIFYRYNVFRFQGVDKYQKVITWLDKLHEPNQSYLENLEITVPRPSQTAQIVSTQRRPRQYYSKSTGFSKSFLPDRVGTKDNDTNLVDPSIEFIISHLANRNNDRKMTLCLDVGYTFIPGIDQWVEDKVLVNMDLPDLVETWRQKYDGNRNILNIIWKVSIKARETDDMRGWITGIGWEIVHERQDDCLSDSLGDPPTHFFLQSNGLQTTSSRSTS